MDDYHCITVWDWRKGKQIASTRGHGDKVRIKKASVCHFYFIIFHFLVIRVYFLTPASLPSLPPLIYSLDI